MYYYLGDLMKYPKVAIIILNWNGWRDTIECLESLFKIEYPNYNVIVVDNGSSDNSLDKIREYCQGKLKVESKFFEYSFSNKPIEMTEYDEEDIPLLKKIEIHESSPSNRKLIMIKNQENYGFAVGNNIGIEFTKKYLDPDYLLLLNNDTVVNEDFLNELIKTAKRGKYGIIGPKVYYYDFPNKLQVTRTKIHYSKGYVTSVGIGEYDKDQYDKIIETDHAPGSCFLIKKEVIDKIGLLNSNYYCYWEEVDYCVRALKSNYPSAYCSNSKIWHKVSKSSNKVTGFFIYFMTRNMLWFLNEHASRKEYLQFLIYFFSFRFWCSCYDMYRASDRETLKCFLRGTIDGLKTNNKLTNIKLENKSIFESKILNKKK